MTHLKRSEYLMRPIDLAVASDLVERFHYSHGGSNTGVYFHGLFSIDEEECLGAAWWLPPTKPAALSVSNEWRTVLSLTRLALDPHVPTNGASFLLGASMRAIKVDGRWKTLLTYADEGEGHTGAIYRATNWTYLGTRPGQPRWVDPVTGHHVARKATRTRTNAEMLALGYVRTPATRKHKFVKYL